MTSLVNSTYFVFCPPPFGKPNPKESRILTSHIDSRSRVLQKGCKKPSCVYAVFNLLRERYKAPNTEHLEERRIEKIASARRKAMIAHHENLPDVLYHLNDEVLKKLFTSITKSNIKEYEANLKKIDNENSKIKFFPLVEAFIKQNEYKNLYDFFKYVGCSNNIPINEHFFSQIKIDPAKLFDEYKRLDPNGFIFTDIDGKNWNELDPTTKAMMFENFANIALARLYALKVSTWHPTQNITALIEELQAHGPLTMLGSFGIPAYLEPPIKLNFKIEDREVYGWKKSVDKVGIEVTGHAILVVGAEKTDTKELVYYIDPIDESDPEYPEKQRIFAMTYKSLISPERICDILGFVRSDAPAAVGYAYYKDGPAFKESKEPEKDSKK